MTLLRRVSYGALALAFAHIVFGAIVRITGSGLGCGDHWPRCHGYWFPPFDRLDLVIEVMHRYLAFSLSMAIAGLLVLAFSRRREPGVGGTGGVLRPIALAATLVVTAALFGAAVVKLELRNKYIIVVHLAIAISTLASLALAAIRAGGLGGAAATPGTASAKTWRGARVAAALAFVAVVMGGLTAHIVGANGACVGFPHCPRGIPTPGAPLYVHLAHRAIAFLLFFHLLGMVFAVRKRGESPLIQWATRIAFGTVLLQILVAAALVELYLPPVLRSLHQAVGTLVWLSIFVLAVLARRGSTETRDGAPLPPPPPRTPRTLPDEGTIRRGGVGAVTVASVAAEAIVAAPVVAEAPAAEAAEAAEAAAPSSVETIEAIDDVDEAPTFDEPAPVVSYEPEVLVAMATGEMAVPVAEAEAVADVPPVDDVVTTKDTKDIVEAAPVVEMAAVAEEPPAIVEEAEAFVTSVPFVVEDEPTVDETTIDEPTVEEPVVVRSLDDEVAEQLQAVVGRDPFEDDDEETEALLAEAEELDADDDFEAAIAAALPPEPETEPVVDVVAEPVIEAVVETPVIAAEVAQLPPAAPRKPPTLAVLIARGADF